MSNGFFPPRPPGAPKIYAYEDTHPQYAGLLKIGYTIKDVRERVAAQYPTLRPGEPPYRIDRMLTQLRLAGKLNGLAGLLIGEFNNCNPDDEGYTVWDTLREFLTDLDVPILARFPAGHGPENWTFPLGLPMRISASEKMIEMLDPAVLSSK